MVHLRNHPPISTHKKNSFDISFVDVGTWMSTRMNSKDGAFKKSPSCFYA